MTIEEWAAMTEAERTAAIQRAIKELQATKAKRAEDTKRRTRRLILDIRTKV